MGRDVYDDDGFFAAYSQLPRSVGGLDRAPEWPALRALLPDLDGARVVDLGCGFGWFARWAAEQGASSVVGVDRSANMLGRARRDTVHPAVSYRRADLEELEVEPASIDLAYSSLALHYVEGLRRLLEVVHGALVPGGHLVFSVEHPVFTAPSRPGFVTGPGGGPVWPLDGYLATGPRVTDWLAPGVVKHHRTVSDYLGELLRSGFTITALEEWGPSVEQVADVPEWAPERERPPFMLVGARA